jgi:uncharacterized membrane protein YcjF (UPF0283 family)
MRLPELPDDHSRLEERRRWFARVVNFLLWVFAIAALLGAAQVARALWSRAAWVDYRGQLVTHAVMLRELLFFGLVVILCTPLAWFGRRVWRRGR